MFQQGLEIVVFLVTEGFQGVPDAREARAPEENRNPSGRPGADVQALVHQLGTANALRGERVLIRTRSTQAVRILARAQRTSGESGSIASSDCQCISALGPVRPCDQAVPM